jgi:propanol-preferring alcohol dehydrogenase
MASFKVPVIMGHEVCGEIVEIGEGVEGYEIGDIVSVCPLYAKDGTTPGYTRDGGYATVSTAPVEQLIPVPDNVDFARAAAATDAGMTSRHAVVVAGQIKPGMKVGIIGIGGLGQIGARIAVVKGCEVYVSSRKQSARDLAMSLGCAGAVETAQELAEIGCEVIVDFAGAGTTTAAALEAVAYGGRVVVVGMSEDFSTINTMTLILKQAQIVGSCGGDVDDIKDCYEMMASGDLDPVLKVIKFEEIGEGIGRVFHR